MTFLKKVGAKSDNIIEGEPIVISNISGTDAVIEKYNNFIDMSVEGTYYRRFLDINYWI